MKVTKSYIKQLVKEELNKVLKEERRYGVLDPEGALSNFGARTVSAIQDAFYERSFDGGRLRAGKSTANEFAIYIDWGSDTANNEVLVYYNEPQNRFYVNESPASTPHDRINQEIDNMKLRIKNAVEIDNRLAGNKEEK